MLSSPSRFWIEGRREDRGVHEEQGGEAAAGHRITPPHTRPTTHKARSMARRAAEDSDTHMDEAVDQGLGMEETGHGLLRRPSLRETYNSDSLLAPDTDFMGDDHSSAASGVDVVDRLTYLEQRMQMQEDEIQLLKMALSDVLKRLNISEEHQAAANRKTPSGSKARPVSLALPSRPPMVSHSAAPLKKSTTLPSASSARNYSASPPHSHQESPAGSVKDSPCTSKTTRPRPTSAAPTCKKTHESKAKEPAVSVGSRRVTHCKVTMQIYLSPLTRRTGSSEAPKSAPTIPNTRPTEPPSAPNPKAGSSKNQSRPETHKTASAFNLPLQKTTTHNTYSHMDTLGYKSPLKSPSQYFQICY
ncbi:LOW QUALITY PROTEIN: echinoderm microtubule-associated protein-like 4 [Hypomesus transpacificus]|uniref:LOW QUALITY PROTEIN: echinoderm microtubule-associated protein-like 4 n=1 Tax=Hypomesus transpacificus TaxID=137520 RepID=UPI001F086F92|nr:LOW QUALITY PROTEIN: echinoderm microtubule-associated protein-like 4 [Hypomesus transpacificus]